MSALITQINIVQNITKVLGFVCAIILHSQCSENIGIHNLGWKWEFKVILHYNLGNFLSHLGSLTVWRKLGDRRLFHSLLFGDTLEESRATLCSDPVFGPTGEMSWLKSPTAILYHILESFFPVACRFSESKARGWCLASLLGQE